MLLSHHHEYLRATLFPAFNMYLRPYRFHTYVRYVFLNRTKRKRKRRHLFLASTRLPLLSILVLIERSDNVSTSHASKINRSARDCLHSYTYALRAHYYLFCVFLLLFFIARFLFRRLFFSKSNAHSPLVSYPR